MAELLKGIDSAKRSKMNLLFKTRSLCILLGLIMMGDLIAGAEPTCSGCSGTSTYSSSFTVRNALPQSNSNLHMVCSIWSDCGGYSTYSADIPCNDVEVPLNQPASCTCTSTPPAVLQVVCEFTWTKPNDEIFVRAPVLVWSGEAAAPNKTYYLVDDSGFWFSNAPDGTLKSIGGWGGGNYLSSETYIVNKKGAVKGFGRSHCIKTA